MPTGQDSNLQPGLPHTRGGVSVVARLPCRFQASSPHAWGCFRLDHPAARAERVFPTRVGVFPRPPRPPSPTDCLPHTRGGVSHGRVTLAIATQSSPHAWGCFRPLATCWKVTQVFPTRVGVFPSGRRAWWRARGLPHTRGGVSGSGPPAIRWRTSSPHAWGCFFKQAAAANPGRVFPTRVGVFPSARRYAMRSARLPHTRGGVSRGCVADRETGASSPHAWGCFQIPC